MATTSASALTIAFKAESSSLPEDAKGRLDGVVRSMTANDRVRAQIIAYAAGTNDTASQARRLSLSRALAVRSYLIEKGIASTRLDVRALGHQVESGSPDRVDIALAAR
ncbi:MAG TPA: OmpA family protein [Alphaproteobacteria bacterium]|nr:OmpA family protein [Alphaproteobacteria bacterium]